MRKLAFLFFIFKRNIIMAVHIFNGVLEGEHCVSFTAAGTVDFRKFFYSPFKCQSGSGSDPIS